MSVDIKETTEKFLKGVTAIKAPTLYLPSDPTSQPSKRTKNTSGNVCGTKGIDGELLLLLGIIAVPIPPSMGDLGERAGLNRRKCSQLVKTLVESDQIRAHEYHPSRRGGAIRTALATESGWQTVKSHFGRERPQAVVQGSDEHNMVARTTAEIGRWSGFRHSFEATIGPDHDLRSDVLLQNARGQRIYVECELNSMKRLKDKLSLSFHTPIWSTGRFVAVCRDKRSSQQLVTMIKEQDNGGDILKNTTIRLIGDVLEAYYKKSHEII